MFVPIRRRAPPGPTRHLAALVQEVDGHKLLILGQYLERSASEAVHEASEQEEAFRMPIEIPSEVRARASMSRQRESRLSCPKR